MHRYTLTLAIAVTVLLAGAGCPERQTEGDSETSDTAYSSPGEVVSEDTEAGRPYDTIHDSAKEAWFLVETAYYVIKQKYLDAQKLLASDDPADQRRGSELREESSVEIEKNIFGVNDQVEKLFLDAIAQEPDNALNYATYAYYLKARKRFDDEGGYVNTEEEAIAQIDKAIELWPDSSRLYLLKIQILTAPHQCHDWFRSLALEEIAISRRMEDVRELFRLAEQYDPDNHFINYYKAILLYKFTPPEEVATAREEILREIRAGNQKPHGYFFFPPPLNTREPVSRIVKLTGKETYAVYVDHWNYFGQYDTAAVDNMLGTLIQEMQWDRDREDASALMYMLYQLGRTIPFDRTFFGLQFKIIDFFQRQLTPGSEEAVQFTRVMRFLEDQYHDLAVEFYNNHWIEDSTMLDMRGVFKVEMGYPRTEAIKADVQGRQGAFLKRVEEILGVDFPLPADPDQW